MQIRRRTMQRGQTMVEVIIAIGVLLAGIIGLITLSYSSLSADRVSSRKIVAMNLAREGIEALRNIRDSNWLAGNHDDCSGTSALTDDWLYGIMTTDPLYHCKNQEMQVLTTFNPDADLRVDETRWSTARALPASKIIYRTADNTYVQPEPDPGTNPVATIYKRFIRLIPRDTDASGNDVACTDDGTGKCVRITHIQLFSDVEYAIGSKTYAVEVATVLYNWKP